jgi:hypothetical protein
MTSTSYVVRIEENREIVEVLAFLALLNSFNTEEAVIMHF